MIVYSDLATQVTLAFFLWYTTYVISNNNDEHEKDADFIWFGSFINIKSPFPLNQSVFE